MLRLLFEVDENDWIGCIIEISCLKMALWALLERSKIAETPDVRLVDLIADSIAHVGCDGGGSGSSSHCRRLGRLRCHTLIRIARL